MSSLSFERVLFVCACLIAIHSFSSTVSKRTSTYAGNPPHAVLEKKAEERSVIG